MTVADLSFIKPLDIYEVEKPYFLNISDDNDSQTVLETNLEYTPVQNIELNDIRNEGLAAFQLDSRGFQIVPHSTSCTFDVQDGSIGDYCDEIVRLVREKTGAEHAICYDYRLRKNEVEVLDYEKRQVDYERDQGRGRSVAAPPVFAAHVDHSVDGGPQRIRRHLTADEAEKFVNGQYRARIINAWRPLRNVVEDCPLAICDPHSIDTRDLVAADRVTPDFAVELYYLRHNSDQRWYWLSQQAPNELLLFTNYDSNCRLDRGQWLTCPHTAFRNKTAKADAPVRESIEVRVVTFNHVA